MWVVDGKQPGFQVKLRGSVSGSAQLNRALMSVKGRGEWVVKRKNEERPTYCPFIMRTMDHSYVLAARGASAMRIANSYERGTKEVCFAILPIVPVYSILKIVCTYVGSSS